MNTTEILTGIKNWVAGKLVLKQDVISDLATIRSGAAAGTTAVQPSDLSAYFNGAAYDGNSKRINFYHGQTVVAYIDATAFVIDGMVEDVRIENGYLIIDFNTASGKQDISIPLTDIFDPSNYYTSAQTDAAIEDALNDAKEEIDAKLDGKANNDGYYGEMTVGSAENLVGRGTVEADYNGVRTTSGTDDVGSGSATITKLKGNSVKFNQLIRNGNFADGTTGWGKKYTSLEIDENGHLIVKKEAKNNNALYQDGLSIKNGHKYYASYYVDNFAEKTVEVRFSTLSDYTISGGYKLLQYIPSGYNGNKSIIAESNNDYDGLFFVKISPAGSNGDPIYTIDNIQLFDLTQIFGEGNEPATVEEFEEWLAENVGKRDYYPYNAGAILNNGATGIKTRGFNLYDYATGKAYLCGKYSDYEWEYEICGTFESISYTDVNGNTYVPELHDGRFFNVENAGELTVVGGNNTDTLVHMVWSGWRNEGEPDYQFEPYWESLLQLNLKTITGKLNGTGESQVIFPYGLAKIGNVQDEIVGNVATKRIGRRAYEEGDESNTAVITDGTNTQYVLPTPETYILDEEFPTNYRVDDFGTEEAEPAYTDELNANIRYDVQYAMNAVDAIRRLPANLETKEDKSNKVTSLSDSNTNTQYPSAKAVYDSVKAVSDSVARTGVYDVTANNRGATFASLSALLSDANIDTLIPTTVRQGGMEIRFVNSSDNKYVQYMYMGTATTGTPNPFLNVENWRATDIIVRQLNHETKELIGGEWNDWEWIEGAYITDEGVVTEANNLRYSKPVKVKAGDIITVNGAGSSIAAISKTDAGGTSYIPVAIMNNNTATDYTWTANEDCYIAISGRCNRDSGNVSGYIRFESIFVSKDTFNFLEQDVRGLQEEQTIYSDYAEGVDIAVSIVEGKYIKRSANNTRKADALSDASNCGYTAPIRLSKKQKISFYCQGSGIGNICITDENGNFYTKVVAKYINTGYAHLEYIAENDCYVSLSSRLVGFEYQSPKISTIINDSVNNAAEELFFNIVNVNIEKYTQNIFESGYYSTTGNTIPTITSNDNYKCLLKTVTCGDFFIIDTEGLGAAAAVATYNIHGVKLVRYQKSGFNRYFVPIKEDGFIIINCYKSSFSQLKVVYRKDNVSKNSIDISNLQEKRIPAFVYNQIHSDKCDDRTKYYINGDYTVQKGKIIRDLPNRSFITRFAVFGDMHIGWNMPDYIDRWHKPLYTPSWEDRVGLAFKNACKHSVDFGLAVGDQLQYAYSMVQEAVEERDEYYRQLKNFDAPMFNIDGNHDTGVPEWTKNGVIEFGNVRIICFYAALFTDTTTYVNAKTNGDISDNTFTWLSNAIIDSAQNGYITILSCHYPLAKTYRWNNPDYSQAPLDTGYTPFEECIRNHRMDVVNLCEQYGVTLMLNGHVHWNGYMLVNKDDDSSIDMMDVEFGNTSLSYHIVTIYNDRIVIKGYDPVTDVELRSLSFPLTNQASDIVTTGTWDCR